MRRDYATAPYSLKRRLFVTLLLSCMLPLTVIGIISYYSIYSMLSNKIDKGIRNTLHYVASGLNKSIESLDYTSRQLAFNNHIIGNLQTQLNPATAYDLVRSTEELRASINLVYYTNPDMGLMLYYIPSNRKVLAQSLTMKPGTDFGKLPFLASLSKATVYGPHPTRYTHSNNLVFSILREVTLPDTLAYVYIESNFNKFRMMLSNEQYGLAVSHVLLNAEGDIVYSESEREFPVGGAFREAQSAKALTYRIYEEKMGDSWTLAAIVKNNDYNSEIRDWFRYVILLGIGGVLLSAALAWTAWRSIYRPLTVLYKEIKLMRNNNLKSKVRQTNVIEFNNVLQEFEEMKETIGALFLEVQEKEKNKGKLEVEKLMYQINPHFLHNTLNTIQWLARANGQESIARFVTIFTRLLHYNLGKEGEIVKLREECEAIRDYVDLQKIRYDFEFDVRYRIDPEAAELDIPRFLLQPLVENALYHGISDEGGQIELRVVKEEKRVRIEVQDNGAGMSEEELHKLLEGPREARDKVGMGIGLSYVQKIVHHHYGDKAAFRIHSAAGQGTRITLQLPATYRKETFE